MTVYPLNPGLRFHTIPASLSKTVFTNHEKYLSKNAFDLFLISSVM